MLLWVVKFQLIHSHLETFDGLLLDELLGRVWQHLAVLHLQVVLLGQVAEHFCPTRRISYWRLKHWIAWILARHMPIKFLLIPATSTLLWCLSLMLILRLVKKARCVAFDLIEWLLTLVRVILELVEVHFDAGAHWRKFVCAVRDLILLILVSFEDSFKWGSSLVNSSTFGCPRRSHHTLRSGCSATIPAHLRLSIKVGDHVLELTLNIILLASHTSD